MGLYGSPELIYNYASTKCRRCKHEYFLSLARCPKCGHKRKNSFVKYLKLFFTGLIKLVLKLAMAASILVTLYFFIKGQI